MINLSFRNLLAIAVLITLASPAVRSAVSFTGASSNIRTDGAAAAYNLYAAFAYLSPADPSLYSTPTFNCDGVTTNCNTCIGDATNPLLACSPQSSFPTSKVSFAFSSSTAATATSQWLVCATASGGAAVDVSTEGTATPSSRTNSTTFGWETTWAKLCERLVGVSDCSASGSATLTFGLSTGSTQTCTSGLTDKVDFKVYISSALGTSLTPSLSDGTHGEANGFALYPGDEKLFIPEESWSPGSGFPKSSTSGLSYTSILFFYSQLANPTDSVVPADIKNNSPTIALTVDSEGAVDRDYLDGLENDKKYCFRLASQDSAGVIAFFTPDANIQCEIPSEVMGLLSDKKCFIATAAYGSDLDSHVTVFRKFRNEFLLSSSLGKLFVKIYYRLSPPLAQLISQNELLRTVARWILWPLLGFVELSLAYGLLVSLFCFFIFLALGQRILRLLGARLARKPKNISSVSQFMILLTCIFLIGTLSRAQTETPPNEPPYTTLEPGFDGGEISSTVPTSPDPTSKSPAVTSPSTSTSTPTPLPTVQSSKTKEATEYIQHPNSKKGLYLIDSSRTYHYRTNQLTTRERSTRFKISNMPAPQISNSLDNGEEYDFADMYGEGALLQVSLDYEWNPFPKIKQIYGLLGVGFSTATGNGFFRSKTLASSAPKESYKLFILPLDLGLSYRFEYRTHQWLVPYLSGGGTYFVLAEIRDDSKKSSFLGTPAAFGALGALLNIISWSKDLQFRMDREYGISDMWLDVEFRAIASANKDLDFTAGYVNVGFAVDY
jgi:hypothetical protein